MLIESLRFVLETLANLLTGIFLLRFLMQWVRAPFRNPLGQFVIAASDWAVIPVRKILPGLWGMDVPSLFLAWLTQGLCFALIIGLAGNTFDLNTIAMVALLAVIECVRVMLYLVFGVVLMMAILSWVNPYAPLAPLLNTLSRPFLAPFQRFIPPVGGVDLSPLVLIVVLQLLLGLLAHLRVGMLN